MTKKKGADAAINAPLSGSHIQIIACAGSGKTETLARRAALLLSRSVEPANVVAFTFTEKAAAELKQRILDRAEEVCSQEIMSRIGQMYVGTIHAYALRLIQTYAPQYGTYDLIDESALRVWLARYRQAILGIRGWKDLWDRLDSFLRDAGMIENEALWPKGSDEFSNQYRTYVEQLNAARLLTFGRSIAVAVEILRDKKIRARVHQDIRYLFVDEYQDVNPAQEALIKGLVGPNTQLCVVGDDDQAIYQWRGSDVANMQEFAARYSPVLEIELDQNRRSLPSIVTVAADFAETITPRMEKEIRELRIQTKRAFPVRCLAPNNRDGEADMIAAAINDLIAAGWKQNQIAILIRQWKQAGPILRALEKKGIPFDCGGGTSLFATELGYLLAAAFVLAAGWRPQYGWRQSHLPVPPESAAEWSKQIGSLLKLTSKQIQSIQKWLDELTTEAQGAGTRPASLVRDVQTLAEKLGARSWDLTDAKCRMWFGTLARFSQVLLAFEQGRLTGRWVRKDGSGETEFKGASGDRGSWFYKELANYLNGYALSKAEGYTPPPDISSGAVQITTVHSAKGLQWHVVFLPGIEKGIFPSGKIGQLADTEIPKRLISQRVLRRYAGSDADERRLFYVAMTRARDLLVLSCAAKANVNAVTPSEYIQFVRQHDKAYMPKQDLGSLPRADVGVSSSEEKLSLSFSELAFYGNCAYAYQLANEFTFAPPISRDLGYGKSIHHVLRRVGEIARETGSAPPSAQIDQLFRTEFHVPFASGTGQREMAAHARGLVDRYLNDWKSDLEQIWEVERPFELHLGSLIIAGRADVILDTNNSGAPSLTIVDYKSGTPTAMGGDQLRTYAAAAQAEGFHVERAVLHNLKKGEREEVSINQDDVARTLSRVSGWASGIKNGRFPANPEKRKCSKCDFSRICRHRV